MLRVLVTNRKTSEQKSYRFNQNLVVFGRAPDCHVVLSNDGVSRRHFQILLLPNKSCQIEDLGSGNGTQLNRIALKPHEKHEFKTRDKARVEDYEIEIEIQNEVLANAKADKLENTDPDILEIKMIRKVLGAMDGEKVPTLIVATEPFGEMRLRLDPDKEEWVIGREPDCALAIGSVNISRYHAKINAKWGGYVLTDLGSKNGTFINGKKITEQTLKDGDQIAFGIIPGTFRLPGNLDLSMVRESLLEEERKATPPPPVIKKEPEEKPTEPTRSAAAAASVNEPAPAQTATEKKSSEKKSQDQALDKMLNESSPAPAAEPQKKSNKPKKKTTASFSTSEKILLVIGFLVLAGLVWLLVQLL